MALFTTVQKQQEVISMEKTQMVFGDVFLVIDDGQIFVTIPDNVDEVADGEPARNATTLLTMIEARSLADALNQAADYLAYQDRIERRYGPIESVIEQLPELIKMASGGNIDLKIPKPEPPQC